jgi:hypothetical protein
MYFPRYSQTCFCVYSMVKKIWFKFVIIYVYQKSITIGDFVVALILDLKWKLD